MPTSSQDKSRSEETVINLNTPEMDNIPLPEDWKDSDGDRKKIPYNWNCDICNRKKSKNTFGYVWGNHHFWGKFANCEDCHRKGKNADTEAKEKAPVLNQLKAMGINLRWT